MIKRKQKLIWGAIAVVVVPIFGLICIAVYFAMQAEADMINRQKYLLHGLDHQALAQVLRQFASEHGWAGPIPDSEHPVFLPGGKTWPSSVDSAKPSSIAIFDDRVQLECGGPLLHFGIAVFKPGLTGYGQKQLGDGIWFYSENGRVPE